MSRSVGRTTLVKCEGGTLSFRECLPEGMVCSENPCTGLPECHFAWPGIPCGNLPEWGHCGGDHLFECREGEIKVKHCKWLEASVCGRVGLQQNGCSWYF
jgi:hypothetical protein